MNKPRILFFESLGFGWVVRESVLEQIGMEKLVRGPLEEMPIEKLGKLDKYAKDKTPH